MTDPIEKLADERATDTSATPARSSRATPRRVTAVSMDRHPGFRVHRLGHPQDSSLVVHPSIESEWDAIVGNGAGLVNCAAWARRIEAEGIGTGFSEDFLRGLIHR